MAPSRKKGGRAAAAAAAAARQQWKIGDLVLAKMKGFPAWPAMVSEPEKWGFSSDRKKLLVYFYGTKQIAFCNYADIEAFTEEKKKSLLVKRQGKGADFVRAVEEIIDIFEKKQKLIVVNSDDEGNKSQSGHLEDSKCKSSSKSPVISLELNNKNQPESVWASSENQDDLDSDEFPKTSADVDDNHKVNTLNDESFEKVSILDQLRQTPLSTTTTTRKRMRDGSLQSSVIQRVPSLRRCRNSTGGEICIKIQKSSVLENCADEVGNLNSNVSHEECTLNKKLSNNDTPFNVCSDDNVSDTATTRSDTETGRTSMSCCKLDMSNGVAVLNGKLDLPNKAAIHKKKRKPNRKRATDTLECPKIDKEAELQSELNESLLESPNCRMEVVENFIKADGDEHLPLVKRARVRMGKQSVEETQLGECAERRDELEAIAAPMEESSSCQIKKAAIYSPVNDCNHADVRDTMIWKVNKFQFKGLSLDVEAALPPSKRLHRALEAMSANAAETTDVTGEIICDSGKDSPKVKTNLLNNIDDGTIGSPMRSQSIISSDIVSEMPLKVESVNTVAQSLQSPQKNEDCYKSCIDKISDTNNHEHVTHLCSSKPVKEHAITTSNEGVLDRLSPLEVNNEKEREKEKATLKSSKECSSPQIEPVHPIKPVLVLNSLEGSKVLPSNGTAVNLSAVNMSSTASNTSGSTKSPCSQSDESIQARDMLDVAKEVKHTVTPKDWGTSDSTPIKDLIAAAQKKRYLSRSTSFPYNIVDGKDFDESIVSPLAINRSDSSGQGSPQNTRLHHRPTTDERAHYLQNGSRSPYLGQRNNGFNKSIAAVEVRRSFEALLGTLSRTKDSIGRATRLAIDCAKYGIAGEVIEMLLQHLERESSMHKRVDLFFLVDSIIQSSRSQRGGTGDVYLSIVQSVLPRLLSAAAPHGNTAWENRRQCLKVLKLWLERKNFPESIVRHHIRELESINEASLPTYSRRPARTERALDDPIREMEGMFVDEYGSNTSFHLQNFIHPPLRKDDEGSSDDEKSFEAVTPEHIEQNNAKIMGEEKAAQTPNIEKAHHILAEVDGELEMEDVAPPCVAVANNTSCGPPPLPQDLPPTPPPLPASPPPLPHLVPLQQQFISQGNRTVSEPLPYYTQRYGYPKQIPPPPPPPRPTMYSGNNYQPKASTSTSVPNKPYHLQPPPPTVSNQFSYIQAEVRPQSSYGDRFQYVKNGPSQGGSFYSDRNIRRSVHHDNADRDRFSPAINTRHIRSDKAEALPRYGPYSEQASNSSHGWSIPPRISSYSVQPENQSSRVNRSQGYWQPR